MSCSVEIDIRSNAEIVWNVLTDARDFPRWNSTVTGIEGQGVRTFVLTPHDDGSTHFVMQELFSSLVFALFKRTLPDFRPIFEAYANDLTREAERIAQEPRSVAP